jgi:hypothetical protein
MKKIVHIIFVLAILIEIILAYILYFSLGNPCGSPCDPYDFFNPFGHESGQDVCFTVCVYTPHPYFYMTIDLL